GVDGGSPAGALSYDVAAGTVLPAGDDTLTVTAAGTGNYNAASRAATLHVNKATPTASVGAVGPAVYDGQAHGTAGAVLGVGGTPLGGASMGYDTADGSAPVNAGSYTATGSFAGDDNYLPASGAAAVVIARAASTTSVAGGAFTYDGAGHGATSASVSGAGG